MKIFSTCLYTETNTFSAVPTRLEDFYNFYFCRGGEHKQPLHFLANILDVYKQQCHKRGWHYIESICTGAQPAGNIVQQDYETLREMILTDLKLAGPVDMILLNLHGGMVAQAYDDPEGDLLKQIRAMVGAKVPIGVLLDPHSHLSDDIINFTDLVISAKQYPHTDFIECAEVLFDTLSSILLGKVKPHQFVLDCRMIQLFPTTKEPMISFVKQMKTLEQQHDSILSISLIHGFPWGDIPFMGTKVIVITDNHPELGKEIADQLYIDLTVIREKAGPDFIQLTDMVSALEDNRSGKPVVIADYADNVGGGAPGDSTFILQTLLDNNIEHVAISAIYDPESVLKAISSGKDTSIELKIGGKVAEYSGQPVVLTAEIVNIALDMYIDVPQLGEFSFGDSVWVRTKGLDIVLNNNRCQTYSTDCFTKLGIDLTNYIGLVVKSSQNFRASFDKIATNTFIVSTPGTLCPDLKTINYQRFDKNIWPFV